MQDVFAFAHGVGPMPLEPNSIKNKQKRLQQALVQAGDMDCSVATADCGHGDRIMKENGFAKTGIGIGVASGCTSWFQSEVKRLRFDLQVSWRVTQINVGHNLCPTYPEEILVPHSVSDTDLVKAASFRWSRRIPSVVFRNVRTGAVLARCSQPEVGILGWRSKEDEKVIRVSTDLGTD